MNNKTTITKDEKKEKIVRTQTVLIAGRKHKIW
jgi:hypothetical protein